MTLRKTAMLTAAAIVWVQINPPAAHADNQMGYKLISGIMYQPPPLFRSDVEVCRLPF